MKRTLLAAVLAAAAATPAAAAPTVDQDLVYTVTASDPSGAGRLEAACVFRADRWTADYGPTYVDAVAATPGMGNYTTLRCTIEAYGTTWVDASVWANGSVATIQGERHGTIPVRNLTICVEAFSQFLVDATATARNCKSV